MENKTETYGGFWLRFIAYILDTIIIGMVEWLLILPILAVLGMHMALADNLEHLDKADPAMIVVAALSAGSGLYLSALLVTWLYFSLFQSGPRQATPGKMIFGLVVIDSNGARLSFARASLRYFSKFLSSAVLMIGYIIAGFNPKKQALHDMIANTFVVKKLV